jgi:hypothetical protein
MPKAMERALQTEARKKFPRDKQRQNRYIYGALRKTGWKPHQPERNTT